MWGLIRRAHPKITVVICCIAALAGASGCGGHRNPLSGADATPAARTAIARTVEVCGLLPAETASRLLERRLIVVGRAVGASRDATLECQLGDRFGEPFVIVSFAPEPIALDVFDAAYGDRAGGNPTHVNHLGDKAYVRTEDTHRVLHVFVHGAVLSVSVPFGPPGSEDTVTMRQLVRLTRVATEAVPANPAVEPKTAPPACADIDATVLAKTLGRPPSLDAGLAFGDSSLICSWSGQPGSVTVSMTVGADDVDRFLASNPVGQYVPVPGVLPRSEGRALSSPDLAGDLVVLVGGDGLMVLQVIPAAGYADASIDTTQSEREVAKAALSLLTQLAL